MTAAALLGLQETINRVLALDEESRARFAALHGRVIGVEVLGVGLVLYFVADQTGRLQVLSSVEGEPDCLIRGAPLDLARSALSSRPEDQLFRGRVELRGETDLAQAFTDILASLDLDWEELLARLVGDIPAHEVGEAARFTGRWAERTGRILEQDLSEYLQEERRLLPTRYEVEEWQDAVDVIRDDVDRLEARLKRLDRRLAKQRKDGEEKP
ncbi:MAG: SCP2 sterol-binding domain-containing protein [Pseudomonadota bacterium]